MESRNASFFAHVFPCNSKENGLSSSKRTYESIEENSHDQEQNYETEKEEEKPRRNKRTRIEKSFGPDFLTYMLEAEPQTYK